jgi:hypothetical protein
VRTAFVQMSIVAALLAGCGEPPAAPRETPVEGAVPAAAASGPTGFDLVRLSREGSGVVAGTAAPGGFVDVLADGVSIGKARASETGAWEVVIDAPLSPGARVLSLLATDAAGAESVSADVVIAAVPEAPGTRPAAAEDGVVAVLAPRDRAGVSRVLQRPGPIAPRVPLGLDTADFDAAGRVTLAGRAEPRREVRVFLDGEAVGTARADDDGLWTLALERPVSTGPHTLRLDQLGTDGAVSLRVEQPFDPSATLAIAPRGGVAVRPDGGLWHLVRRLPSGAVAYTQVFRPDGAQLREGAAQASG